MKYLIVIFLVVSSLCAADTALDIAVDFVAEREGWKGEAYCDEAGNATIGYGELLKHDCDNLEVYVVETESKSREWLTERVTHLLADVRHHVTVSLRPNQEAALVSLAYNIGQHAIGSSTLLMMINTEQPTGVIIGEWVTWDKEHRAGRLVRSNGLSERRALEVALYLQ